MNIEEAARDAAMASAGGKTALTSGGALVGWGFLNSEWVFGFIGALIGIGGMAVQYYFLKRRREDDRMQAAEANRRAEELHKLKIQLYNKQLNGVPSPEASVIVSPPPTRSKQSEFVTDFGGLPDD
ncbi:hypothetical protein HS961_12540 [Comamonas piscis]|uniref:Holin n=1 Tax=Comamonas piscis TaxID=1562974 RepID=A0A7G5EHW3_9BURK|nr:holin [Comamonas piscis]QMV73588.1 hypothetical protein HS961_12540 [Comamonas piscis]WSO32008.1 holin [Comamonas piscis]